MNIIPLSACSVPPGSCPVVIGRRGENGVTQVTLDFSTWLSDFGPGAISLLVRRFGDSASYPVLLDVDGADAVWTVSATDTDSAGLGAAEYVYTVGQTVKKSAVFPIQVLADIGQPRTTPPDPYISWIEQLLQAAAEVLETQAAAEQAAADAEAAAGAAEAASEHYPQIVDDFWYVWDVRAERYVNSGVSAVGPVGPQGPPGIGSTFIFEQTTASAEWTVRHHLGRFPSVTVVDSAGSVVIGDVDYIDENTLVLSFVAPFSGSAYLN